MPPEHTGGVKAEIEAFKEFQHFVVQTFTTQQARLQQLPNNTRTKQLWNQTHTMSSKLQELIDYQYKYVKDLRSGDSADEAAARALPPMFASRQSATNELLQLQKQIDAAANQ